ncbi:hypothetical protein B0H10DRAFT_1943640 [Mycena sp. CBHHK59/15]|nr:hypothetical protein B0H10DRAFT_1943640 [Mycena sp. CBHHK59/15]
MPLPQAASHQHPWAGGMFTPAQTLPETIVTESNDGGDTLWETDTESEIEEDTGDYPKETVFLWPFPRIWRGFGKRIPNIWNDYVINHMIGPDIQAPHPSLVAASFKSHFWPSPLPSICTMPKTSKSKKARQDNLSKATAALTLKRSQTTQTSSELDVASLDDTLSSWDLLLGDELPDVECTELQENNADEEDMELNSAAALDSFGEFLVNAQKAAEKAELLLEQETGRKRKRGIYTGHSKQTLWRQKQAELKLRNQGYSDIRTLFGGAGKKLSEPSTSNEITEISSDSESDSSTDYCYLHVEVDVPSNDRKWGTGASKIAKYCSGQSFPDKGHGSSLSIPS